MSKASRAISSSNHSSPYKYPRRFSSEHQQPPKSADKDHVKHYSPLRQDVSMRTKKSHSSLSSLDSSDDHLSFPPPPSVTRDFFKADATSAYTITDDQQDETLIEQHDHDLPHVHEAPPVPPVSASRLSREKQIDEEGSKRIRPHHSPSIGKTPIKPPPLPAMEPKDSIRKTNTFTSSSHSMVDAGCGGHILSKLPALRCFRSHKHHHTQKFHKTSPLPPPPLVVR